MTPGDRIMIVPVLGRITYGTVTCTGGDYCGKPVVDYVDDATGRETWAFASACRPEPMTVATALSAVPLLEGVNEARERTTQGRMTAALALVAAAYQADLASQNGEDE